MKQKYSCIKLLFLICFIVLNNCCLYAQEKQPVYAKCYETALTDIQPKGWLLTFLQRQSEGLAGHPYVSGYPYNTRMWMEDIKIPVGHLGESWWPYEQTAYYIDGILRCGYLINDTSLINFARANMYHVLSSPDRDGILYGGKVNDWSRVVMFRALMAEYEVTADTLILHVLSNHFLQKPRLFNDHRSIMSIESLLWLYGKTKNSALLKIAEDSFSSYYMSENDKSTILNTFLSDKRPSGHGVTYCELTKIPAILYMYTGNVKYLHASINAMNKLKQYHILVDGCPSAIEQLNGKGIDMAHETCDIIDLSWSLGYLLMATRNGIWGDMIERVIFNAGLGAIEKNFKGHQYYSSPNQPVAAENTSQFNNEYSWGKIAKGRMCYRTFHDTECCTGNIERMMPLYIGRMWMKDNESDGLVAALYGPCLLNTTINGTPVQIKEDTNYPFSENIDFTINTKTNISCSLYFRIPGWCKNPQIFINGKIMKKISIENGFVNVEKHFCDGDKITLQFPMELNVTHWGDEKKGISFERGPLVFTLPVESKKIEYPVISCKDSEQFPHWLLYPKSSWNYAFKIDTNNLTKSVVIVDSEKNTGYPWDLSNVPVKIRVPVVKIKNWEINSNTDDKTNNENIWPDSLSIDYTSEKIIELVPLGASYLRMTILPWVSIQ